MQIPWLAFFFTIACLFQFGSTEKRDKKRDSKRDRGQLQLPQSVSASLSVYMKLIAANAPNVFLARVESVISKATDMIQLHKFYTETNLSFARTASVSERSPKFTNVVAITTLSDSRSHGMNQSHVSPLVWSRARAEMVYSRESFPSNFNELASQMRSILKSKNETSKPKINSLRYHSYMSHCDFISLASGHPGMLPVPIIVTTPLHSDYGYFSSDILPGKSCLPQNFDATNRVCREIYTIEEHLKECGKTVETYLNFLDKYKSVALILTCQHQSFGHGKIFSLPLGVRDRLQASIMKFINSYRENSTKIEKNIFVSFYSETFWYQDKVAQLALNFSSSKVVSPGSTEISRQQYITDIASSKFVVCPPGMGHDTHCVWESLMLGSIPVVEKAIGLDRTYSHLPVLVVYDLTKITVEFLKFAFPCFLSHAHLWHYERLTQAYWDDLLLSVLRAGHRLRITENHLEKSLYCNFLAESPH